MPSSQASANRSDRSLSLVFLGGIADSGKSALVQQLKLLDDVRAFSVSDFLRAALAQRGKQPNTKLGAEVTFIDWKTFERDAIDYLCGDKQAQGIPDGLPSCFDDTKVRTVIINTHFATYSPGGFMVGLDPNSIAKLCDKCRIVGTKEARAAVVLVDIGIADVLHRREERWTKDVDPFTTGAALAQDLEFNRVYALHYFNILTSLLGHERVTYSRVFVDYSQVVLHEELMNVPAFTIALNKLYDVLEKENFTQSGKKWD
jgi:hypothetical protein